MEVVFVLSVVLMLIGLGAAFVVVDGRSASRSHSESIAERISVRTALDERVIAIVGQHATTLGRKRYQLKYTDDYGNENLDKWKIEVRYFIDKVIYADADFIKLRNRLVMLWAQIHRVTDESEWFDSLFGLVEQHVPKIEPPDYDEGMTGGEYEAFCTTQLEATGWNVINKGGSGDQGTDLLAERNGHRVAIQCKCYSSPVGNAAVQEVIAGKTFEAATHAAVVSNATYTVAARQLASTAGVLLLHHDQLSDLESLISEQAA